MWSTNVWGSTLIQKEFLGLRKNALALKGIFLCLRGLEGNARNYSVNGSTSESNNGEGLLGWYYGIFERG